MSLLCGSRNKEGPRKTRHFSCNQKWEGAGLLAGTVNQQKCRNFKNVVNIFTIENHTTSCSFSSWGIKNNSIHSKEDRTVQMVQYPWQTQMLYVLCMCDGLCSKTLWLLYKHLMDHGGLMPHRTQDPLRDRLLKWIPTDSISWEETVGNWLWKRTQFSADGGLERWLVFAPLKMYSMNTSDKL